MNDLVSIIMSTYNEDIEWLEKSIKSIINQTYQNFEFIIVIDNPQNEEIKNIVNLYQTKDNRIKVISNIRNIGLVMSLNKALKSCKGKYVARMDADDISIIERIEKEKRYLEKKNLDFVFSNAVLINEKNKIIYTSETKKINSFELKKEVEKTNISFHPTWFLKKEVYEKLEGYREIPYCEDYDFLLRAFSSNYKIGMINEKLLKYRIRESSISQSYTFEQFLNTKELLKLYKTGKIKDNKFTYNSIKKLNGKITINQKERFIKAANLYKEGMNLMLNGKYLKGVMKKLKSGIVSKVYFKLLLDNIKNSC